MNGSRTSVPWKKIGFGVRLAGKPYSRDLVQLVPKFERKYKTSKIDHEPKQSGMKEGLLEAGLKSLGLGQ